MHKNPAALRWFVVLAGIVAVIVGSHLLLEQTVTSFIESAIASIQSHSLIAVSTVAGLCLDILLPVPSSVISVWAVVSLGPAAGFISVWLGMCLACLFGYWLGNRSDSRWLSQFIKPQDVQSAHRFSARYGALALVVMRAVPVLAEASVLAAGLIKMPFKRFLAITGASNAGIAFIYASLDEFAHVGTSFTAVFVAAVGIPAGMWLLYAFYRRLSAGRVNALSESGVDILQPRFSVNFGYPLLFTRRVFDIDNRTLIDQLRRGKVKSAVAVQFFIDSGISTTHPALREDIAAYCERFNINWGNCFYELPGGEDAKTQQQVDGMHRQMLSRRLDRQSYVIAIGGGGVLDAAGYAAATFHRGIRLIRMPTTVLAQNDAGIGVKNGINSDGIKNLLGCFTVPHAVINDRQFLKTLSARDFRSGFAEAIKVALIRDAEFYRWICNNAGGLSRRDEEAAEYLIKRCAELHLQQICFGGDPFETGSARPLDYGHWCAHKLESLSAHKLSHGEAVAIGMALDALYAVEAGLLKRKKAEQLIALLQVLGFDIWHASLLAKTRHGESAVLQGLEEFRQHLGGELCITLLTGIGNTVEVNSIDTNALLTARDKLFTYANRSSLPQFTGDLGEVGTTS